MNLVQKTQSSLARGAPTPNYLSGIYNKIRQDMQTQLNAQQDEAKAKVLEIFLNELKQAQIMYKNKENDLFSSLSYGSYIETLYQINPAIVNQINFLREGRTQYTRGEYLEKGMAQLVKTIEAEAKGKTYRSADIHGVGMRRTNIDLNELLQETAKDKLVNMYNKAGEYARKKEGLPISSASVINSVQGKIDTTGLSAELQVSATAQIPLEILSAFTEATFTDKNYASSSSIKLGTTNPFRVFVTVAQAANSSENLYDRYARMYNCFKSHASQGEHTEAFTTFYRLRAIYELTGAKMQYNATQKNNYITHFLNGKYAKFLIINNYKGEGLRVISTEKIVQEIFENYSDLWADDMNKALYGEIQISQNKLSSI